MGFENPKIIVVGAGGMGALFGAILSSGGLNVELVDSNREHVDAINRDGLSIIGYGGDRKQRLPATARAEGIGEADLLLFQTKAHASRAAARSARHLVEGGALCISFQNGLGNEEVIADEVGAESVLGGLTAMAGCSLGPGRIRDFSRAPSYIGEMTGGLSERTEAIASTLTRAGLETHASANIRRDIWKKLIGNIAMSAVSGSTNLTSAQCLRIPALKETSFRALNEALSVARAIGIELDRSEALAGLEMITAAGGTGDSKSSLCVDLLNRRSTEVDFIYGEVIRIGKKQGIETPTLKTLASIVKGLETSLGEMEK